MKIKIGFFTIMFALSLILSHSLFSLASLLAALTHELGHILAAAVCRIRLKECKIGIYGAGLIPEGHLFSYRKEILLCSAGPLVNLALGSVGLWGYRQASSDFLLWFSISSFVLGMMNLLPIKDFDGGRILRSLLCLRISMRSADGILQALSFFFIFTLWCFSVYLLLRASSSLSLFIFSISLFVRIFIPEK